MWYSFRGQTAIQLIVYSSLSAATWPEQLTRGNLAYDRGLYREAIPEYERALPLAESTLQHAVTLHWLALAHGRLAEFADAEQCFKRAADLFNSIRDQRRMATSLAGLGEVYRAEHRLDDALATERHTLTILKRLGMLETQQAATVFTITGEVLYDQHHFKAAQRAMRQSLSILEKTVGPDDPDLATCLNNLGVVASERHQLSDAERLLTRALQVRQARFGPAHPLIASTLLSLSLAYLEQQKHSQAEQTCRRSLEMMRQFLPASHPDVLKAYIGLAMITHPVGRPADALTILELALRTSGAQSATISEEYVHLLNLYAQYLADAGEMEEVPPVSSPSPATMGTGRLALCDRLYDLAQ